MKALQNKHTFYIHIYTFLKNLWLKKKGGIICIQFQTCYSFTLLQDDFDTHFKQIIQTFNFLLIYSEQQIPNTDC